MAGTGDSSLFVNNIGSALLPQSEEQVEIKMGIAMAGSGRLSPAPACTGHGVPHLCLTCADEETQAQRSEGQGSHYPCLHLCGVAELPLTTLCLAWFWRQEWPGVVSVLTGHTD